MSQRARQLEYEERKLKWLQEKVVKQQQIVELLRLSVDDPFDEMFERETQAPEVQTPALPAAPPPFTDVRVRQGWTMPANMAVKRSPRPISDRWARVFSFLGKQGKSWPQVLDFLKSEGIELTEGTVRTGLADFRKRLGYVENPRKGFYVATDKVLDIIRSQEGQAPATANSGASNSQPAPSDRAAA